MTNLHAVKNVTAIVSAARAAVLRNSDADAAKVASVIAATIVSAPASRLPERRFSDRAAFVQNATVRLDLDVARYFKSSEDVNVALRMVIALTKTVKTEETPAKVEEVQSQAIETAAETDNSEE